MVSKFVQNITKKRFVNDDIIAEKDWILSVFDEMHLPAIIFDEKANILKGNQLYLLDVSLIGKELFSKEELLRVVAESKGKGLLRSKFKTYKYSIKTFHKSGNRNFFVMTFEEISDKRVMALKQEVFPNNFKKFNDADEESAFLKKVERLNQIKGVQSLFVFCQIKNFVKYILRSTDVSGDAVLSIVSRRISSIMREEDILVEHNGVNLIVVFSGQRLDKYRDIITKRIDSLFLNPILVSGGKQIKVDLSQKSFLLPGEDDGFYELLQRTSIDW